MSYVIDLDPARRILRVTEHSTTLTDQDVKDFYRSLASIASQGGPYGLIVDLSQVEHMPVSANTIRTLAESAPAIPGRSRRLMVAKVPVAYGLCRMFELTRNAMDVHIEVVKSVDEAYESFGVTAEDFSQRIYPMRSAA